MVTGEARQSGYALEVRNDAKLNTYFDKCREEEEGVHFVPLTVQTFGGWHQMAVKELKNSLGSWLVMLDQMRMIQLNMVSRDWGSS